MSVHNYKLLTEQYTEQSVNL